MARARQSLFKEAKDKKNFISNFLQGANLILKTINPTHRAFFQEAIEMILYFYVLIKIKFFGSIFFFLEKLWNCNFKKTG